MVCEISGALDRRHNAVRDWLAKWLARWTQRPCLTEQFVPAWDRPHPTTSVMERARLDVEFVDGHGRTRWVDVTVVDAATVTEDVERRRARLDGAAAAHAEDGKRIRYPGTNLVPFAIEALGRPGASAQALLRAWAPSDLAERSLELSSAWQELSVIIQTANAELLLSAERP
jgi:hypothetical protein